MLIKKEELCSLIPHAGTMCLLDEVVEWREDYVVCTSRTHRDADNPLRIDAGLSAVHAVEYGAQAMAVHGGLQARQLNQAPRQGYLAAIKNVELHVRWLHDLEEPLTVRAERMMADDQAMIYQFQVSAGDRLVATGRTTVINNPGEPSQ